VNPKVPLLPPSNDSIYLNSVNASILKKVSKYKERFKERSVFLGNLLEVGVQMFLRKMGIDHEDTSDRFHNGHVPDFETNGAFVECKNLVGSVNGRYWMTGEKFDTQIYPRFINSGNKTNIVITLADCQFTESYWEKADEKDVIHILLPLKPTEVQDAYLISHYLCEFTKKNPWFLDLLEGKRRNDWVFKRKMKFPHPSPHPLTQNLTHYQYTLSLYSLRHTQIANQLSYEAILEWYNEVFNSGPDVWEEKLYDLWLEDKLRMCSDLPQPMTLDPLMEV